ncbi:MAG: hypothetical protein AMXMBFR72_11010 [Betaproteobacteria bacterium]|nr:MAG: hypothetical protein BroJett031_18360 [Betaproteobacteria bacterium]
MPRPLAFSERKSSSMMTIGKRKRIGTAVLRVVVHAPVLAEEAADYRRGDGGVKECGART